MNSISFNEHQRFETISKSRIMKNCLRCGKPIVVPSNTDKSYCNGTCQRLNHRDGVKVRRRKKILNNHWDESMNRRWDKVMKSPEGVKLLLALIRRDEQ